MQKRNILEDDMHRILAKSDEQNTDDLEPEQGIQAGDEPAPLQDIYVYIVREHDDEAPGQPEDGGVIETTLSPKTPSLLSLATCNFAPLLPLAATPSKLS